MLGSTMEYRKVQICIGGIKDSDLKTLLEYKPVSSTVPSNKRFVDKALLMC